MAAISASGEDELEQEGQGDDRDGQGDFANSPGERLQRHIGDEAEPDAGGGGLGGRARVERGKERAEGEPQGGDERRKAGAAAFLHAGSALDIGGGGRRAEQSAEHSGTGIGKRRLAKPRQRAVFVEESSLAR